MTTDSELEKMILAVDASYKSRLEKQQKFEEENWEGFDKLKDELSKIVTKGFEELLEKLDLGSSEILDYKAGYVPREKYFRIAIKKLKLPDGKIIKDDKFSIQSGCPQEILPMFSGLEPNSNVEDFKKKYHVEHIYLPTNDCEHK